MILKMEMVRMLEKKKGKRKTRRKRLKDKNLQPVFLLISLYLAHIP